ncbi:MAG: right-handed parallel beta-helix repeat-containing protein, partial [Calditrichaeota bacterium]|nr:right-handed parallel beta-helix repeat-containing protein [Calditrichota bacterium]
GVILGGGDRATLTPGGNVVANCDIHDCSRWVRTYRAGIFMYGVGQIVRHNRIHDLPHTAVFFWGNDHLIEYNEIYRVCMETGDAGALYNGRDWTQRGTVIRYNYIHHLHGVEGHGGFTDVMAVYLDDWSSGATIFGNIFYKAGRSVMIGGGRDNLVENNVFIDGTPALHVDARGKGWARYYFDGTDSTLFIRLAAVHPDRPPYSERYPQLAHLLEDDPVLPKGNRIVRNVSSGGKWVEFFNAEYSQPWVLFEDNAIDVDRNVLMDENGRIRIRYDSPALPRGFQRIPVEKIGPVHGEGR